MTPVTRAVRRSWLASVLACACLAAPARAQDEPIEHPGDRNIPRGYSEGEAGVVSFDGRFRGLPTAPLARVKGAFELRDLLVRASPGLSTSLFFSRAGHFARHKSVFTFEPQERDTDAAWQDAQLGLITYRPIPPERGAVVGVLADVARGDPFGVRRYLSPRVLARAAGEGLPTIQLGVGPDTTFEAALPPGRYELLAVGHPLRERVWIDVHPGRCELAVLELAPPRPRAFPVSAEVEGAAPAPLASGLVGAAAPPIRGEPARGEPARGEPAAIPLVADPLTVLIVSGAALVVALLLAVLLGGRSDALLPPFRRRAG
ncbi:MAG: hypothetical protein AB7N76_29900 [Planctomycetota bacterium]